MKSSRNQIRYTEIALILFVWLVLLITPVLFREDNNNPLWRSVAKQLEILIPLSVLFLINRFILVPRFLFGRKPKLYIALVVGVIFVLTSASWMYEMESPPPHSDSPGGYPSGHHQSKPMPPYANFLIFSFLIVGFDTGLRSGLRWIEVENEKVKLEKENVSNQLALLKTQLSPHFFMNTLNNIHSLVDNDTVEAKKAIITLSKMMRYLLYETEAGKTTLQKEMEFIESYVNLMKLRFSEKVKIILNLPETIPDVSIPPFLFTSFIENAFKHGISYKNESFIIIDLILVNEQILFAVRNSKTGENQMNEFSGIGIENTQKRLDLLYGNNYHLDITDNAELFTVNLMISL